MDVHIVAINRVENRTGSDCLILTLSQSYTGLLETMLTASQKRIDITKLSVTIGYGPDAVTTVGRLAFIGSLHSPAILTVPYYQSIATNDVVEFLWEHADGLKQNQNLNVNP